MQRNPEIIVRSGQKERRIPDDTSKFNEDFVGVEMTTADKTHAIVTNLGTTMLGKGTREDAYFFGQVQSSILADIGAFSPGLQESVITAAIHGTIEKLQEKCKDAIGGTTLAAAFCIGDKAYIINVGDSMVCKYSDNTLSEPLIKGHDAKNPIEQERTGKYKGEEITKHNQGRFRFGVGLLVSRSIGPFSSKEGEVTYKAEVIVENIKKGEQLFIASDGLDKELGSGKTGLEMLRARNREKTSLQEKAATLTGQNHDELKSKDDTTILIVDPSQGGVFGVCDGHGGPGAAHIVSQEFNSIFAQQLITEYEYEDELIWGKERAEKRQAILPQTMDYIFDLQDTYKMLHPTGSDNIGKLITFIRKCDETSTEKDLNKRFAALMGIMEAALKEQMAKSKTKNLSEFINYLNKDPENHHQARLIVMLYQDLKVKGDYKPRDPIYRTNNDQEVKDGKRSLHAKIAHSFFETSLFKKKDATLDQKPKPDPNPYAHAREMLNPKQKPQQTRLSKTKQ